MMYFKHCQVGWGLGGGNVPLVMENHATIQTDGISTALPASMGMGGEYIPMVTDEENTHYIVRRLNPLECERLQGFPDRWSDIGNWIDSKGKTHKGDSDSPRYKALGNSIALPFWEWMAKRMIRQLKEDGIEDPTMASLFDGISGFPLVFSRNGCEPVWSSEIEEFPIAVAKKHFPDTEES
jgi:DNA (cytosine-5)-methyltransferase 1